MVKDYYILQVGFDTFIQYIADSDNCQNKKIKKVPQISTLHSLDNLVVIIIKKPIL